MKLHCLDIPESPAQMAVWLDRHLVGASLGDLAAELIAARVESPRPVADLDAWLGDDRGGVLESGLSVLPAAKLNGLLEQPDLLPVMQEFVLLQGGPYWRRLLDESSELGNPLIRGRALLDRIRAPIVPKTPMTPWTRNDEHSRATRTLAARLRQPALVSLATAALLLLAFYVFKPGREAGAPAPAQIASGWGWNKADALPDNATPAEYLNRLADGAQDWFNKQPDDAPGVARRILELRQGCSRLLLADHKPLSNRDRQWLIERCSRWAARFDAQATAVEHGDDPRKVLAETDDAVRKLIDALRDRAHQIATG